MTNKNDSQVPLLRLCACLSTITLVALRLADIIDWAWYWVLAPLWIYAAMVVLVSLIVTAVVAAYKRRHTGDKQ